MAFYDKVTKKIYTLPETKAVAKTLKEEASATSKVTNGGFKAGSIKVGLKAEASSAAKAVGRQTAPVLGKKKKGWKRPGLRGIKGI